MSGYFTDGATHTEACWQHERGPDGAHRRIHRPEPCSARLPDCLHIGAGAACAACGRRLARPAVRK